MGEAPYLAVARFQKPHGLKGEVVVFVLTDDPDGVFVPGRTLMPVDADGRAIGAALTLERGRPYHRRWLLKFAGLDERGAVEALGRPTVGVAAEELAPPAPDEMYVHEIPGAAVVAAGRTVGIARELLDAPGGPILAVDADGRELLIPFRPPILRRVDRMRREIEVDPPPGLLEL